MTLVRRRPRFPPLRSATPPCEAENADHPLLPVVSFSMSPPVPFRMSFDTAGAAGISMDRRGGGAGFHSLPISREAGLQIVKESLWCPGIRRIGSTNP